MKANFGERRKFFDAYGTGQNEQAAGWPPKGARFTCPCCGYPTLSALAEYEICALCSWEDDGQDDRDADLVRCGPSGSFSLVEARENFERYLVMYPPELDTRVGGPDSLREREVKRTLIASYDRTTESPLPEEIQALWRQVVECEQVLYQELKRRINGPLYEGTPCPYCGERLRTRLAKQCCHCGMDWHDSDHIIRLKSI